MANVLWLQGGACSGNTMSFLNAEEPTVVELITDFGLNILWHPTTGLQIGDQVQDLLKDIIAGKVQMDILVYEGSLIEGPNGTGSMNFFADRPMKDWTCICFYYNMWCSLIINSSTTFAPITTTLLM